MMAALVSVGCNNTPRDASRSDSATAAMQVVPTGAAHEVQVIGLDYAFNMPDSVDAGRTAFTFTNNGKVDHEYNVVLLKEGVTLAQYIDAENANASTTALLDAPLGVIFAKPGKTSSSVLSADMLPGRTYAVQCISTDSVSAPTHRALGMFKAFTVRNNVAPSVAALVIDTIVGTDYAYTQYPKTLAPGWHHFAFVNAGKQNHEINVSLLKVGVTLKQVLDAASRGEDVDQYLDAALGVLHAQPGVTPLGTLDFEVLPEREYLVVCIFADTPKSPPHFALGMVTSMLASK